MLKGALDLGITYIDTSPDYPRAEYFIGQYISKRRNEYILATKCGDNLSGTGAQYLFDRKTILDNFEESLRLMKTDYVDVLALHGVIPEYLSGGSAGEAWETMLEIKKSGRVKHLGVSMCNKGPDYYGFPAVYGYNSILRFASWPEMEVIQLPYGCMTRISEAVIQKTYTDYKTGVVARGVVKKYTGLYGQVLEVSRIKELFEEGETEDQFFIRYALSHPGLSNVLVGTKNLGHLEENVKAADKGPLSKKIYGETKLRMNFAGNVPGPLDMKLDW
jgi:aryl-alcohol dehydrogenase-like predicted oxidoreductase